MFKSILTYTFNYALGGMVVAKMRAEGRFFGLELIRGAKGSVGKGSWWSIS